LGPEVANHRPMVGSQDPVSSLRSHCERSREGNSLQILSDLHRRFHMLNGGLDMTWTDAKDVLLLLFAVGAQIPYVFRRSGWFVYPTVPLALAVVWETLGWSGLRSAVTFGLILLVVGVAMAVRLVRHQPVLEWTSTEPIKDFIFVWGAFGISFVATIVIALN
jgi:hypothetical protein